MSISENSQNTKISHVNGLKDEDSVFYCHSTNEIFTDYQQYIDHILFSFTNRLFSKEQKSKQLYFQEILQQERNSVKDVDKLGKPVIFGLASLIPRFSCKNSGTLANSLFNEAKNQIFVDECVSFIDQSNNRICGFVRRVVPLSEMAKFGDQKFMYQVEGTDRTKYWLYEIPKRYFDTLTHSRVKLFVKFYCEFKSNSIQLTKHAIDKFGLNRDLCIQLASPKGRTKRKASYKAGDCALNLCYHRKLQYKTQKKLIKLKQKEYLERWVTLREDLHCDDLKLFPEMDHVGGVDEMFMLIELTNFFNGLTNLPVKLPNLPPQLKIHQVRDSVEGNDVLYFGLMDSLLRLVVSSERLVTLFDHSRYIKKWPRKNTTVDPRLDHVLSNLKNMRIYFISRDTFPITINRFSISEIVRLYWLVTAMEYFCIKSCPRQLSSTEAHALQFCNEHVELLILLESVDVFSLSNGDKTTLLTELYKSVVYSREFIRLVNEFAGKTNSVNQINGTNLNSEIRKGLNKIYRSSRNWYSEVNCMGCDRMYRRYWFLPSFVGGIFIENSDKNRATRNKIVTQLRVDPKRESWVQFAQRRGIRCVIKSFNSLKSPYKTLNSSKNVSSSKAARDILRQIEDHSDVKWMVVSTPEMFDSLLQALNPRGIRESNLLRNLLSRKNEIYISLNEPSLFDANRDNSPSKPKLSLTRDFLMCLHALNSEIVFSRLHFRNLSRKNFIFMSEYISLNLAGGDDSVRFMVDTLYDVASTVDFSRFTGLAGCFTLIF